VCSSLLDFSTDLPIQPYFLRLCTLQEDLSERGILHAIWSTALRAEDSDLTDREAAGDGGPPGQAKARTLLVQVPRSALSELALRSSGSRRCFAFRLETRRPGGSDVAWSEPFALTFEDSLFDAAYAFPVHARIALPAKRLPCLSSPEWSLRCNKSGVSLHTSLHPGLHDLFRPMLPVLARMAGSLGPQITGGSPALPMPPARRRALGDYLAALPDVARPWTREIGFSLCTTTGLHAIAFGMRHCWYTSASVCTAECPFLAPLHACDAGATHSKGAGATSSPVPSPVHRHLPNGASAAMLPAMHQTAEAPSFEASEGCIQEAARCWQSNADSDASFLKQQAILAQLLWVTPVGDGPPPPKGSQDELDVALAHLDLGAGRRCSLKRLAPMEASALAALDWADRLGRRFRAHRRLARWVFHGQPLRQVDCAIRVLEIQANDMAEQTSVTPTVPPVPAEETPPAPPIMVAEDPDAMDQQRGLLFGFRSRTARASLVSNHRLAIRCTTRMCGIKTRRCPPVSAGSRSPCHGPCRPCHRCRRTFVRRPWRQGLRSEVPSTRR